MRVIPQNVVIEVTNRCNLQCRYCPNVLNAQGLQGRGSFPTGDMDFEFFKSIVDRVDFDTSLGPWLNGEPLMHPRYLDMIKYITEKKLRFYTTTNLTIWDEEFFEFYLGQSTAYQLIISMDGTPYTDSISLARPGTNKEHLLTNIIKLLEMKKRLNSRVELAFKICERGQDYGEIEEYIQFWLKDARVDFIIVGKALKDINPVSMRSKPCQYSDPKLMLIRWNGQMVMCGYNDACVNGLALSYGKLDYTTPLLDMYNNEFITKFREDQRLGIYPPPCDLCSFAYTGYGYEGEIKFRNDPNQTTIYHTGDYYNTFYSKHHSHRVPKEFYTDERRQ